MRKKEAAAAAAQAAVVAEATAAAKREEEERAAAAAKRVEEECAAAAVSVLCLCLNKQSMLSVKTLHHSVYPNWLTNLPNTLRTSLLWGGYD